MKGIARCVLGVVLSIGCSHCGGSTAPTAPASAPASASASGSVSGSVSGSASTTVPSTVTLPAGDPGIGFDDLRFASKLDRVLVPGGRSGNLDLVDPSSFAVSPISGFSAGATYEGGHDFGVTSADEGDGVLFATDRTSKKLVLVDAAKGTIASTAPLGAHPDYVRWVAATKEAWVTQPDGETIEIFSVAGTSAKSVGTISIPGGPESLVIDQAAGVAYTHLWKGKTVAVDVKTRKVGPVWSNGCEGSRGIDVDPSKGLVFAGCSEGKLVALDTKGGAIRGSVNVGAGVDVIAYDAKRAHLYAPGGKAATTAIVSVSNDGTLSALGIVPAAKGSHCVTTDLRGRIYVCDPSAGRILVSVDSF